MHLELLSCISQVCSYVFLFIASFHTFKFCLNVSLQCSCCLPVTRGRCPPGCPLPQCPRCPGCSEAWPQTPGLLGGRRSWSRVNRWRWWRPESAQETDPGPVQQLLPQTGRSKETGPLQRLSRTQATDHHTDMFTMLTRLTKISPKCSLIFPVCEYLMMYLLLLCHRAPL